MLPNNCRQRSCCVSATLVLYLLAHISARLFGMGRPYVLLASARVNPPSPCTVGLSMSVQHRPVHYYSAYRAIVCVEPLPGWLYNFNCICGD